MAPLNLNPVVIIGMLITLVGVATEIEALQTTSIFGRERPPYELRDAAIRDALLAISTGKLPPNDDKLIELITQNVKELAAEAIQPTAGIEAAARQAQEAVSEVTAAYTAIIFKSSSVKDAERLFRRYQDTVDKIVEFARSGGTSHGQRISVSE